MMPAMFPIILTTWVIHFSLVNVSVPKGVLLQCHSKILNPVTSCGNWYCKVKLSNLYLRWIPHPVVVDIRDNSDYIT